MQFTYLNMTSENSWKNYRYLITLIMNEAKKSLKIKQNLQFSVILVDEEYIHTLNKTYRHKDMPTDVISFASLDSLSIQVKESTLELGDIFINVSAIRQQAMSYQHSLKREFSFLVTHGLLHLLGYDHLNPKEEKEMFDLQEVLLRDIAPR